MRSRLDCGNAVLVGLSTASSSDGVECGGRADLFPGIRRPCRADAVVSLHWSRVPERIAHKVAALTYKVIRDIAPRHLGPLVRVADLGRLNMEKWRTKFDYYVLLYYVNVRKMPLLSCLYAMIYKRSRSRVKGQGHSKKTSSDREIIAHFWEIGVAESNGNVRILIGSR